MGAAAKLAIAALLAFGVLQEQKPVPKGSQRVSIAGCAKKYIFTAAARREDQPTLSVPEGTHFRMNGPKKLIQEIDAHQGSVIVITGLMKEGQVLEGPSAGGRVRFGQPGGLGNPLANQLTIDVEGWRPGIGDCPS